jgi:medium-chain acyl-[acyl-carrier-protein] hydrolase
LEKTTSWLVCQPAQIRPGLRLFCLPHAGGGSIAFHSWRTKLPPFVQVCSVLPPGREKRLEEPPHTRIEPLVEALTQELAPWLDVPFVVFGHSMGALLAFEWIRNLRRNDLPMPKWIFLSGRPAPDTKVDSSPLRSLPDREFLEELKLRYRGMSQDFLQDPDLTQLFLPVLRADIAIVENYQFHSEAPLNCPMTVFGGVEDATASYDQLFAWKKQTQKSFRLQLFPGGHFYPQDSMLKSISNTLIELIEQ